MQINTKNLISISEANQNFSKVARMVEESGTAIILKNNSPKFILLDYKQFEAMQLDAKEHLDSVVERLMNENSEALEELDKRKG